jgi:hypothetical protein
MGATKYQFQVVPSIIWFRGKEIVMTEVDAIGFTPPAQVEQRLSTVMVQSQCEPAHVIETPPQPRDSGHAPVQNLR